MRKRSRPVKFAKRMRKKLLVLFFVVLAAFAGLGVRLFAIGKSNGEAYRRQVLEQQQYDSVTIPYRRGLILDRNDMVLATSEKVYNVILDSNALLRDEKYMEPTMNALRNDLGIDTAAAKSYAESHPDSRYRVLEKNLTYEQISAFRDKLNDKASYPDIRGIWFEEQYRRQYPNGSLASSVTGFTTTDNSGTGGIEEYYNSVLSGTNGREYGYQNADSTLERTTIAAKDGNTVCSTIDSGVQTIVEDKLRQFNEEYKDGAHPGNGAENLGCIIMEVNTGKVLAMADYPFFDPNDPRNTDVMIGMREVDEKGKKTNGETEMKRRVSVGDIAGGNGGISAGQTEETAAESGESAPAGDSGTENGAAGNSVTSGAAGTTGKVGAAGVAEVVGASGTAGAAAAAEAGAAEAAAAAGADASAGEGDPVSGSSEDSDVLPEGLAGRAEMAEVVLPSEITSDVFEAGYIGTGFIAPKYVTAESISFMDTETLNQNYYALWKNFCINETYEPGSVAKPFTVASGIDCGAIKGEESYNCEGLLEVGDHKIYCHNRYGDGILNVSQALERSCNVCLMQIAFAQGVENFTKYQDVFGFGLKSNVDLAGESRTESLIYTAKNMRRTDLATNSFGQGFNVTMIQMISAFCSLINGGNLYQPMVVDRIETSDGATIENMQPRLVKQTISKTTSAKIRSYLYQVVFGENGTGKTARPCGYAIGGKTGTAETLPRKNNEYVLSFMGYAPADDPQIAIYVVVDRPNVYIQDDAKFATRIVKEVLQEVLPYLGIYMTEPLSEKEKQELADKGISPIFEDGRNVDMPEAETEETAEEEEQKAQEKSDGDSGKGKEKKQDAKPEAPVVEDIEPKEPWKEFPIDPETGYAIDPKTNALVDPNTGVTVMGGEFLHVEDIEPQEQGGEGEGEAPEEIGVPPQEADG